MKLIDNPVVGMLLAVILVTAMLVIARLHNEHAVPQPIFAPRFALFADGLVHSIPDSTSPPRPPAWAAHDVAAIYSCPPSTPSERS